MFSNLKVPKQGQYAFAVRSEPASVFGAMYAKTMEMDIITTNGRMPECRPSGFPICSVLSFLKMVKGAHYGYYESKMSASGGYFTSVGTAAHENIQYYIGETGKVWGDWSCRNPTCTKMHDARDLFNEKGEMIRAGKTTRESTTNNKCPKCKHPMDYVEKQINYKGIKGHVDCIVKLASGGWWVADYKTSTQNKIKKGSSQLPVKDHMIQVPTYCIALEKQYKIKVDGFSLLYLSRDNPFIFYEHAELWTPLWRKNIKAVLKTQRKRYQAALISFSGKEVKTAIKHKTCKSLGCYMEDMGAYTDCPFLEVCFKPGFTELIQDVVDGLPYKKKAVKALLDKVPEGLIPVKLIGTY